MKRGLLLTMTLLIAIGAGAAFWMSSKKAPAKPEDVTFFFTADTRGRLVPCGCFTGQYGGLTRLKTILDSEAGVNGIRLDIGDAIRGKEDYNLIEYKYMLQAYASMNFDALNLGHREAQLSSRQLQDLKITSPVSLLSANLLSKETGKPVVEPYKVIPRGKYKIALIGVMDPRVQSSSLGEGLAVERMEVALERILPELKQKADVIALLAFTDEANLTKLAQEFYELDVILGGKVSQPSQKLEQENQSMILYTGNEGRALAALQVRAAGRGKVTRAQHEILLLHDKIPQNENIQSLANQYRKEIRNTKLSVDDPDKLQDNMVPGVKGAASYTGSESCITCHVTAGKVWSDSGHAHAMATLVSRDADADPNCITCHTVGFGTPSGYRREFAAKKLIDVGCESCHGPGSLHVEQRQKNLAATFKFRPLGAGDCQKCHYGEFSRPFDWNRFWPEVQHGKEPVSAARIGKESK